MMSAYLITSFLSPERSRLPASTSETRENEGEPIGLASALWDETIEARGLYRP